MDELEDIKNKLVHLAKVAIVGDPEKIRTHLLRQSRSLMARDPALAHLIREVATSAAAPAAPNRLRGSASAVRRADPAWQSDEAPADRDSQLDLLRVEDPPRLPHEPVYDEPVRQMLAALIQEHAHPEALLRAKLAPTRTVLLAGAPGVGKTLAARWIAQQLGLPLLVLDLGTVMSRFLGATGGNLKKAIGYASQRPCVLLLDELDAVAKRRDDVAEVGELKRLVTVLLQELDEWPEGRLLIAATNHPQLLDAAVWRRFEARIELGRPDETQLRRLLPALVPEEVEIPSLWQQVLPSLLAGTSYSELAQTLKRLRRAQALTPQLSAEDALMPVVASYLESAGRAKRKEVALSLESLSDLSERAISNITGVSRDTLRRARSKGEPRK